MRQYSYHLKKDLENMMSTRTLSETYVADHKFYRPLYGIGTLADAGVVYSGDDACFFAKRLVG